MVARHSPTTTIDAWRQFQSNPRFRALDGLRCLSILAVIWHHGPGINLGARSDMGVGDMGVIIFFAISGFLITTLLLREHDRNGTVSLPNFYMRRSLRIFPLYYTVVGIYLVSVQLVAVNDASSREFLSNLPYFLTYTSNWFGGKVGTFAFAWSLAAEEQFYSTWPWAVYFLKPRRAVWFVALLLTATIVLRVVDPSLDTLQTSGLPARSWWLIVLGSVQMSICWGCLLAFLLRDRRGFAALWMVLGHRWTGVVVLPLTLLTLASPSVPVMTTHFLSAVLVGACVIREDTALARVARPTWVAHIGIVSYGMYLLHGLVYSTLGAAARRVPGGWTPHSVSGFVAATLFTTAAATISFRYFESPFLRLKARFSGNRAAAVTS